MKRRYYSAGGLRACNAQTLASDIGSFFCVRDRVGESYRAGDSGKTSVTDRNHLTEGSDVFSE